MVPIRPESGLHEQPEDEDFSHPRHPVNVVGYHHEGSEFHILQKNDRLHL
jgi:hypothetical protein